MREQQFYSQNFSSIFKLSQTQKYPTMLQTIMINIAYNTFSETMLHQAWNIQLSKSYEMNIYLIDQS